MRRFTAVAALLLAAACGVSDDSSITEPTLQRPLVAAPSVGASCPAGLTFASVRALMLAVYVDGSPDENAARGKFDNIEHHFNQGSVTTYRNKAWDLAQFTIDNRDAGKLTGSQAAINEFLNGLFCLVGLGPYFTGNSFFIYPSDNSQILETTDGLAGVNIPANNVTEPTLLTITPLTTPPVFDTKLDVYPFFYQFEITNAGGTGWVNPIIVGVCPPSNLDPDVMANLLLGHQDGTTFEILPDADASFLDCSAAGGGSANITIAGDSTNVAAAVIGSAGVGGSTDNFSPIAPVDSRVVGSSGAGGTADNFRPRGGMTPSMNLASLPSVVCSPTTALIGQEVDPACRPEITFHTPQGTLMEGIPVSWAVESGGGKISNPGSPSCPSFVDNLIQNTGANGKTTVCWKLGNAPGANTVVATANPGGDAPLGVNFQFADGSPNAGENGLRFTATGIRLDPAVTATGASGDYTGSAFTGSGTCTPNSLTPVLSYNTGNGQAPVNAGTYELTVTCGVVGDPDDIYSTQTATATITINPITTTTTVTCPASVNYNGSAQTPCSATVTGSGGFSESATVTYTNNTNAGTANASATYVGDANHTNSSDSKNFTINQATTTTTVTCPASVNYNGSAQTPCSASVSGSDGLSASVAVTHTNNTNAGTANASATYAGDANHVTSTDARTFTINKLNATATAGNATIQYGNPVPTIPCTVTGLLASQPGAVTCTTSASGSSAGTSPTVPVLSPTNPPNYNVTLVNGTLTVLGYVQVGCFASPIFSVMPGTKSAQNKGSNLPVKCTLKWPNGSAVTNATGSLLFYDLGSSPLGTNPTPPAGAPTLPIANAFSGTSSGNYSYGLNTGVAFFVSGRAYFVRATWSDGSTTTGYFRIK